ncbi:MAG TPA: hypothetical protein PLK31_03210, partial [Chloroflexota bacterium]|nr:hypothetical protein [Chloroflexota bacterium]
MEWLVAFSAGSREDEKLALARALKECARVLNSTLAYEEVLDQVIMFAGRVIPHDATSILLLNGDYVVVERASGYEKYQD